MTKKKRFAIAFTALIVILGGAVLLSIFVVSRGYWWVALIVWLFLIFSGYSDIHRASKETSQKDRTTSP